jgi:hypothetical protein
MKMVLSAKEVILRTLLFPQNDLIMETDLDGSLPSLEQIGPLVQRLEAEENNTTQGNTDV